MGKKVVRVKIKTSATRFFMIVYLHTSFLAWPFFSKGAEGKLNQQADLFVITTVQKGFTLLELLLVLAIITLGSAIIIPNINNTEAKLFNAQLRELAGVLKYNRRNAVVTGEIKRAQLFNPFDDHNNIREHEERPKKGQWYSRGAVVRWLDKGTTHNKGAKQTLVQAFSTEQVSTKQAMLTVQFFPQGGATGGTLLLQQDDQQAQLVIDSFNGKLSIKYPENR